MTILVILLGVAAFVLVLFDVRRGGGRAAKAGQARGQRPPARAAKRPPAGTPSRTATARKRGNGR
jgi:hypothetical protein